MTSLLLITFPRTRYAYRDRVIVHPEEAGCPPFEATITGIRYDHRHGGEPEFTITEDDGSQSDGWTERYFTMMRQDRPELQDIQHLIKETSLEHRLQKVNAFIQFVASFGARHFFCAYTADGCTKSDRVGKMVFEHDKLWWIDEYTLNRIDITRGEWTDWVKKISHGAGLRCLIHWLRDFAQSGKQLPIEHLTTHWGYSVEDRAKVIETAKKLGLANP